jgi:alcohol dehydrogenase class IV
MQFDLKLPSKVVFGWGRRASLGDVVAPISRRAWFVPGSRTLASSGVFAELENVLSEAGVSGIRLPVVTREPEVDDVDAVIGQVQQDVQPGDCVIAVGGGSAIDFGKAIAALATNPVSTTIKDYLEGVGLGLKLTNAPLPIIAVPTTAGTGTEATKNAVISSYDPPFKKSLRDERLVPTAVLIDPELTVTNPLTVTAHSGMDAITQLIESLVTKKANPFTRALCMEGLRAAVPALPVAVEEPTNRAAREAMAYAAWLSGVTLANAGLGLAHGVAAALGVHCRVPHGLACAVMLPTAMRVNLDVRRQEFAELGELFAGRTFGSTEETAEVSVEFIVELGRRIGIPGRLRDIGVEKSQIAELVPSSRGNSMSGNPRDLSDAELLNLLESIW